MISNRRIFLQHNTSPYLDALPPWGFPCPRFYPCWSGFQGSGGGLDVVSHPRSEGKGFSASSESLDVSVLFAQYRYLVLEQNGIQSHLRMDQGHGAKPAGKFVHARLPLGKVVRICPDVMLAGRLRRKERVASCYIHLIFNIRAALVVRL